MKLKRKQFFMDKDHENIKKHLAIRDKLQWKSSSGYFHFLKDMDRNYIKNCINKIEKENYDTSRFSFLKSMKMELIYREILKIN